MPFNVSNNLHSFVNKKTLLWSAQTLTCIILWWPSKFLLFRKPRNLERTASVFWKRVLPNHSEGKQGSNLLPYMGNEMMVKRNVTRSLKFPRCISIRRAGRVFFKVLEGIAKTWNVLLDFQILNFIAKNPQTFTLPKENKLYPLFFKPAANLIFSANLMTQWDSFRYFRQNAR